MKKIIISLIALMIGTLTSAAEDKIVSTCGDYKIIYTGETLSHFAGVRVTMSTFYIEAEGLRMPTTLQLDSEGGLLTGEVVATYDTDGDPATFRTYKYENAWGVNSLTVFENSKLIRKNICTKMTEN